MTDLARLRRCARILRRAQPDLKYRVSLKHMTIFQIGSWAGMQYDFSQSLEDWEQYAEKVSGQRLPPEADHALTADAREVGA